MLAQNTQKEKPAPKVMWKAHASQSCRLQTAAKEALNTNQVSQIRLNLYFVKNQILFGQKDKTVL